MPCLFSTVSIVKVKWDPASRSDLVLETGSIIHWGEPDTKAARASHRFAVTCGLCKKKRIVSITTGSTKPWTGFCRECTVHSLIRHPRWRGGRTVRYGYIFIRVSTLTGRRLALATAMTGEKYIQEHRLLVAEHLDRPLQGSEIVHHLNELKTDNRISNLVLTSRDRHSSEHQAILKAARAEIKRLQAILDKHQITY